MKTVTFDEKKWKLVPIEPTDEMCIAAISASLGDKAINGKPQWDAMIAAAPEHKEE